MILPPPGTKMKLRNVSGPIRCANAYVQADPGLAWFWSFPPWRACAGVFYSLLCWNNGTLQYRQMRVGLAFGNCEEYARTNNRVKLDVPELAIILLMILVLWVWATDARSRHRTRRR